MKKKTLVKQVFQVMRPWAFFDGASQGHPTTSGVGVPPFINQSHDLSNKYALGRDSNNKAKFVAIQVLLFITINLGCKRLHVMSVSKLFINWVNNKSQMNIVKFGSLTRAIKDMLNMFNRISFSHISREYHTLVDGLLKQALLLQGWAIELECHDGDLQSELETHYLYPFLIYG